MTETIRTPDQITDKEIARAVWHTQDKSDPIASALSVLSPVRATDFLRENYAQLSALPEYQAWRYDSESMTRLRERIATQVEAYRNYTVPTILTTSAGRELVAGLARYLWRGVPTWDRAEEALATVSSLRDLAETLGYPDVLRLDEILPAASAAWDEIAKAAHE